jgi:sigma-B regulation protein RsbU (phosphoserine phosphatase)
MMADSTDSRIRDQLADRRSKLESVMASSPEDPQLKQLLNEVDAAIIRLDEDTYGRCTSCNEQIEPERLIANPTVQYCLGCLTPAQQQALEEDLELAIRIQVALLPPQDVGVAGWRTTYHYDGAGPVSGDYCDLLNFGENLYFALGDISGKGIAASMLMAHLHATFRALVTLELPLEELIKRVSRIFCESTLPTHFATLIIGKAGTNGDVNICNAGHCPPLLVRGSEIEAINARGLPIGVFCDEHFPMSGVRLNPGDSLFLYTDGLLEATDRSSREYGIEKLSKIVSENHSLPPGQIISACLRDLTAFQSGEPRTDDLTMMVIRKL